MANMSYCRFENTLRDLRDCYDNIDGKVYSETEHKARLKMVELCQSILDEADCIPEFIEDEETEE